MIDNMSNIISQIILGIIEIIEAKATVYFFYSFKWLPIDVGTNLRTPLCFIVECFF